MFAAPHFIFRLFAVLCRGFLRSDLGQLLRSRRKDLGITQIDLSEVTGISQSSISEIELGTMSPTLELLIVLCNGLRMSVQQLVVELRI